MAPVDVSLIAKRHGIRMPLQFGSTVTGPMHERGDVDLGVVLERSSIGLRERAELEHDLQSLFPETISARPGQSPRNRSTSTWRATSTGS